MIIGIDFDETLTLDAKLWRGFVDLAIGLGHRVICVTSRRRTYENMETISQWMVSHRIDLVVYYTALASKTHYMASVGVKVDVWIDNDPKTCALGH